MLINGEDDFSILKRAEDLLDTEFNWNISDDDFKGYLNEDEFEIIDNLCSEIDRLKEQIEDIKEQYEEKIKDYYRPISKYELYGLNERDF